MNITTTIPENITRAARAFGCALLCGGYDRWSVVGDILLEYAPTDRAALAFVTLRRMDLDDALDAVQTALANGAGQPPPPLFNAMDEAAHWADWANPDELEAYCLASFKAMPSQRKTAFLEYVQGRIAA